MKALIAFFLPFLTVSTIVSDTGCYCALKKNAVTTPWVNTSVPVGCSYKSDWNGLTSKWCLTDQTTATCGINQSGFGMVDSCAVAGLTNLYLAPPVLLDAAQGNQTFYTGQMLTMNWTVQNILPDENVSLSLSGRTLGTISSSVGSYQARISDSPTSVTNNTVVLLQTGSSPQVNVSSPVIAVVQSKIASLVLYNNMTLISIGASVICDGRNISISWQGIGEASIGTASVTVRSSFGGGGGGGGTTVGTAITGLVTQANMTVGYTCPRSQTIPGFGNSFAGYVTIQSPSGSTYTLTSPTTFSLVAAPTPTPTGTATTTPSPTPTPSLSTGSTASNTPSTTPSSTSTDTPSATVSASVTPTLSITSSASFTASPSKTPAASIDLAAVAAQAQAASMNALGQILGGICGSIGVLCVAGFGYYIYQRRQLRSQRLKRNEIARRRLQQQEVQPSRIQTVVMYQQGRTRR